MAATIFSLTIALLLAPAGLLAQKGPVRGPIEARRDPELEAIAKHNLEVARWYITRRKAYEGALDRLKEIVETYPDFSHIDEVVFFMGEANLKMNKNDAAIDYYKKLMTEYPDSQWAKKARERLDELKVDSN